MATNLELFADYFQIHVLDDDSEATETGIGDVWTEQAVLDGLGVAEHALAIGTAVNVTVDVTVGLLPGQPDDDSCDFDHVVEASLNLASGRLVVLGCTEYVPDAARFDMPAGWTRIRTSRRNLEAAAFPDLDCEDEPEDMEEIRIQAWPAPHSQPHIIKRWTPPEA
ncbi:hypothetical protein [Streptomyces sp. NBC_00162]|uniref:hypothetical protein n=1 Tax=Streptomyces sp. NBC_00162 TaxID=2903629 RepID=UPI00214B8E48|nr:hypothetical protein [Streptomyces sp. NBC_00162]UUU44373.1 hypothetical protein JIW86_39970 [Streptomyces sp. NBC_00162]